MLDILPTDNDDSDIPKRVPKAKTEVLDQVIEAHKSTVSVLHSSPKNILYAVAKRLYMADNHVTRLGYTRPSGEVRNDLSPWQVLASYISRRIYITEKKKRNAYMFDEVYHDEVRFNTKLWQIYCNEVFGKLIPELPLPDSYLAFEKLLLKKKVIMNAFCITDTVLIADMHSSLLPEDTPNRFTEEEFNHVAQLPSSSTRCWTKLFALRSANDKRHEGIEALMRIAIALFKYDAMNSPEPYKNFWKEQAYNALDKFMVRHEKALVHRLQLAVLYETEDVLDRSVYNESYVKKIVWHLK